MEDISEEEAQRTIEVNGIPADAVHDDDICGYFENKRFGGGEIQKLQQFQSAEDMVILLTFKDESVVDSLLKRHEEKKTRVSGFQVELQRYTKPQPVPVVGQTVIVSGIPSTWEEDDIIALFENPRKGGPVETVSIGEPDGLSTITFSDQSIAEKLVDAGEIKSHGCVLNITWPLAPSNRIFKNQEEPTNVETICPRTIVVKNCLEEDEENLMLYLENKRRGGGKIEAIERKPDGILSVTFADEKVAAAFLEKEYVKMGGKKYPVSKSESLKTSLSDLTSSIPNTIEVSGIPATTSEDFLRMYFENKKRSGGGEIRTMTYNSEEGVAVITFSDPNAAMRVVTKGEHKISSDTVQVIALESLTSDLIDKVCAISVTNIPSTMSKELLQIYFESEKRSGGGDFEEFEKKDDGSTVIVYSSPEVCKRVTSRSHILDSVSLKVEALTPAPPPPTIIGETDVNKLMVGNLPTDYSKDDLKVFLEKVSGSQITHFHCSPLPDVVLVEFRKAPSYEALRKLVVSKPFKSEMLTIQKVKPTSSILVRGAKNLSNDMLMLHFENYKRSGGGEVKNIRREANDVIIEFQDESVIQKVLKTQQTVDKQKLKTELYHDCFTRAIFQRSKLRIPEDFTVSVDEHILKFISQSSTFKTKVEADLMSLSCEVIWLKPADGAVKLSCKLMPGMRDLAKLAANWDRMCTEKIAAHLENISTKDEKILAEIWQDFLKEVKSLKAVDMNVEFDDSNFLMRLVGVDSDVEKLLKSAADIKSKLLAQLAKQKSKKFRSVTIKANQLKLLKVLNFPECRPGVSKDLKVLIDETQVSFEGSEDDINQVMIEMYEVLNNMTAKSLSNIDQQKLKFFQKRHTNDYLTKQLKQNNLKVIWSIVGNVVEVCGMDEKDISQALVFLESEIDCRVITVDINSIPVLKLPKWKEFKKELEKAYLIVDIIEVLQNSALTVLATKDAINQIVSEIEGFLHQNTLLEQFVKMEDGVTMYFERFLNEEVKDLHNKLLKEEVVIELMMKKNSSGILIRGTKSGLQEAVKGISDLQQRILSTVQETDLYGVQKCFSSKRGKESIEKLQDKNRVIVDISRQSKKSNTAANNDMAGSHATGPTLKSTVISNESVIKVLKGEITKCHVDVIVIPIGQDLKHTDGIAKSVLEAGGQMIEDECREYVKISGQCLPGQVYLSKPGSLSCSGIIHLAMPLWAGGTKQEVDSLEQGIWNALQQMEKQVWTTVAISGITNFPAATAAQAILNVVQDFTSKTSVKMEVQLIDTTDQVVNHFHETLVAKFGKAAVKVGQKLIDEAAVAPVRVGTIHDQLSAIQTKYQPGKDKSILQTPEGVQVSLIQGTISTQQVDVLFNTASQKLVLSQGAVSNSILQAAGPNLQAECTQKLPNGLVKSQVLVTSGYNLKCKHVYHGACESWDGGKGQSEQLIRDLLKKAFETAHQSNLTSIAMPALGTGNLGTPREIVSRIMYEEAEIFSRTYPGSTLKDIRFVVFDQPTVDVFQGYAQRLIQPSSYHSQNSSNRRSGRNRQLKEEGFSSPGSSMSSRKVIEEIGPEAPEELDDDDISFNTSSKTIKIKSLEMEVVQGDITQEKTDAIVNSTNKDLNLSGGAVTKAILDAGGPSIIQECKKLGKTNADGVAVTGPGNLKCKYIIHLATPDSYFGNSPDGKQWEERILKCLKQAEKMKLKSIAFPLLGTGKWNTSAGEMAISILNGIGQFSVRRKTKYLEKVRISIFQTKMVDEFFQAAQKRLEDKKTVGVWGKVKDWLSSWVTNESDKHSESFEIIDAPRRAYDDFQSIFRIYGTSQKVIDRVLQELEDLVKEAITDRVLDSATEQEAIAKLTHEQIKKLENDAANHQVRATVEQGYKINRIRLQGDATDIADVVLNISGILREMAVKELKRGEAERIAQQAHWEYQEDDGSYEQYPSEINAIIEKSFLAKLGFAKWEENDGEFKIDFKSNTEENVKTQKKVVVRRIGDAPIEEPKHWEAMNLGEPCRLVQVAVGSQEYSEVEARIKATCDQCCKEIIKMERIQNHNLYQQYAVKKMHMEAAYANRTPAVTVEHILWHGTRVETVPQINLHGFNRSYCGLNATAFGKGVYFARDWTYSAHAQYSPPNQQGFKSIYQVRVLTGEFTMGNQAFVDTPVKPNSTVERYDSVVNDVNNPSIFVVFRDAQVYPEYLITFI